MVVPFDDHDKVSLSIFGIFERIMLNPTGSWHGLFGVEKLKI